MNRVRTALPIGIKTTAKCKVRIGGPFAALSASQCKSLPVKIDLNFWPAFHDDRASVAFYVRPSGVWLCAV